jgi:hypothetical protein
VTEAIKILQGNFDQLRLTTYKRLDSEKLSSSRTINEQKNPYCEVCSDDSKFIFAVESKRDWADVTLEEVVDFLKSDPISIPDPSIVINGNLIYEGSLDLEEDELEMNSKKAKKSLKHFGFEGRVNLIQVSSTDGDETSPTYYLEFNLEPNLQEDFKIELLKKGGPKKPKPATEAQANKLQAVDGKVQRFDVSDDDDCPFSTDLTKVAIGIKRPAQQILQPPEIK